MTAIFELTDGRIITKKVLPGRAYFKFKQLVTKDIAEATRWVMLQMFEIDGQPLTIDQLEDEAPIGIGFEGVALLDIEVNKLFLAAQVQPT